MKYYASKYIGYYFPAVLFFLILAINIWQNFASQVVGISILFIMLIYKLMKSSKLIIVSFDILVLVIFIYEVISQFISISCDASLPYLQYSFFVTLYYFAFRTYLDRKKKIVFLLKLFSLFSFFLSVISLISFSLFDEKIRLMGFTNLLDFKNLYAPLGQMSNVWSSYLLCFVGFIFLAFSQLKYSLFKLFLWGVILLFPILAIIHTFSRGAYISLIILLFSILIFIIQLRISGIKKIVYVLIMGLIMLSAFCQQSTLDTMKMNTTLSQRRSTEARIDVLKTTKHIFKESPILGVGSGNYSLAANKYYYENDNNTFVRWSANSLVQLLVEKGLLGLILWLLVIVLILKSFVNIGLRNLPALIVIISLVILAIKEFTFSSFFEHIGLQLLVFTLFAILQSELCKSEECKLFNIHNWRYLLVAILVFIFGWLVSVFLSYLKNEENMRKFVIAMHENESDKSKYYISRMVDNTAFLINKSIFEWILFEQTLKREHLYSAKDCLQKAIVKNKRDYLLQHNLANILQCEGKNDSALIILNRLVTDFPNNTLYRISIGKLLYRNRKVNLALIHLEKAIWLSPTILDAPFWINFEKTDSVNAATIKERLKTRPFGSEDPILIAKYGKLCLGLNDTINGEKYLSKAIELLPNLSRPWYYLGIIAHNRGDLEKAFKFISISEELSRSDYFPASYLSEYYFSQNNSKRGIDYQNKAILFLGVLNSERNRKYQVWYNSKPLNNQIIPTELQFEIIPEVYSQHHSLFWKKRKNPM